MQPFLLSVLASSIGGQEDGPKATVGDKSMSALYMWIETPSPNSPGQPGFQITSYQRRRQAVASRLSSDTAISVAGIP